MRILERFSFDVVSVFLPNSSGDSADKGLPLNLRLIDHVYLAKLPFLSLLIEKRRKFR